MRRMVVVISLVLATPMAALASGIPVVDVTGIAQMVTNATQQAQQALDMLNAQKETISQAKSQFDHIKSISEGNWNMGDVLNDPTLNSYLPAKSWSDIYNSTADLVGLRQKYGLTSSNPILQKRFDNLLTNLNVLQKSYESSAQRQRNIEQLSRYMNSSNTPQQREDLANRLQYEQIQLANERTRLDTIQRLMDLQQQAETQKNVNDYMQQLIKRN